jgi:dTDP-4-dehydrorhamnose reductase
MLVTGASGFLGRHLVMASERDRWELVAPASRVLDVLHRERTVSEIREWRPTVVVHLAYRRDDRRTIVEGTRHVAEACAAAKAKLVHVSTDLVFPGWPIPYTEDHIANPILPYGVWKLEAEQIALESAPTALVVRPSLLYGTDRLAPCQMDVQRACTGQVPMTFFTDEIRCPAFAGDVASAISHLAVQGTEGIVHLGGPAMSRADFARHVAAWLGFSPDQVHTSTLADAGVIRPGTIMLETSKADRLGASCRPVEQVLVPRASRVR